MKALFTLALSYPSWRPSPTSAAPAPDSSPASAAPTPPYRLRRCPLRRRAGRRPPGGAPQGSRPVARRPQIGRVLALLLLMQPIVERAHPSTHEFMAHGTVSEDCLYLNVWTAARRAGEKRPVLVYFYGGGFNEGAGSIAAYDGEGLAKKGLVVVIPNYRVGVLGFLAHPELTKESDRKASGNYGLLDQLAALQWVRDNIAAFGGDPANVTIAGQSAGAMPVHAMVASPLAKGLFHRAIAQSGQLNSPRKLADAEQDGVRFAEMKARNPSPTSAPSPGTSWPPVRPPPPRRALAPSPTTGSSPSPRPSPTSRPHRQQWRRRRRSPESHRQARRLATARRALRRPLRGVPQALPSLDRRRSLRHVQRRRPRSGPRQSLPLGAEARPSRRSRKSSPTSTRTRSPVPTSRSSARSTPVKFRTSSTVSPVPTAPSPTPTGSSPTRSPAIGLILPARATPTAKAFRSGPP